METLTNMTKNFEPRQILVIEDDPFWQSMIRHSLKKVDGQLNIRTFSSVEEFGATALGADDFDLIISDHFLSGKTGLDLWREFESRKSQTPFLLTSGLAEQEFSELTLNDGTHPYFVGKSLISGQLSAAVRGILEPVPLTDSLPLPLPAARNAGLAGLLAVTALCAAQFIMMENFRREPSFATTAQEPVSQREHELTTPAQAEIRVDANSGRPVQVHGVLPPELKLKVAGILKRADHILDGE